jgi:hypothetical protein
VSDSALPPLYHGWMRELLGGPLPDEQEATCNDCAMCAPESVPHRGEFFDRDTKCCTYIPEIFNFLVGRVLADESADEAARKGRASLVARIARGVAVTPLGLGRPRPYLLMYRGSTDAFGHARTMKCPHFLTEEGGLCGVWRHRMSMCATWYCKHVRGAIGQHFWKSVERLLAHAERALAVHCIHQLDPGRDALEELFKVHQGTSAEEPLHADEIDGRRDSIRHDRAWGAWAGREEEFYRRCGDIVSGLAWRDVRALAGPELAIAERLLTDAYRAHCDETVPERVQVGPFQVVASNADSMRVATYSSYDPLELPRALADVLHRFDGRPVADVLETLAAGDGLELEPATVRKLLDFKILDPA